METFPFTRKIPLKPIGMQKARDARRTPSKISPAGGGTVPPGESPEAEHPYFPKEAGNVLQRKRWRGWRTWGAREGAGHKGGGGSNPRVRAGGDNRTQTGRITSGRIRLGDNTIRNSLGRGALCLTKGSNSFLQGEVSEAGT